MAANVTTAKMRDALAKIILGEESEERSSDGDERAFKGHDNSGESEASAHLHNYTILGARVVSVQNALPLRQVFYIRCNSGPERSTIYSTYLTPFTKTGVQRKTILISRPILHLRCSHVYKRRLGC